MLNRIFANLGFLLQIAGVLTIAPILIGLYLGETQQSIPLFLACVGFLASGFLMNALSERKELDFKSASALVLAAFVILPLVGAIPYVYLDPFNSANPVDKFTNSYFESVSGFTTTGFSFVSNSDTLPRSLLVYRSLTELMGGVGIVFLLLAFFHSNKSLNNVGSALGIEPCGKNLKRTFFSVFTIYGIYIIAFTVIFYFLGFQDLTRTGSFAIDTITGGFQPSVQQFQQYLGIIPKVCIIALMLFGSVNFVFNYRLFTRKFKKAITPEVGLYLIIIVTGTTIIFFLANMNPLDSLFHVVSMTSSTGFSYIDITAFNDTVTSVFIMLMLIGGCAFSMAGGIRVSRLIEFVKAVGQSVRNSLVKEEAIASPPNEEQSNNVGSLSALVSIMLFVATLTIFSIIFTGMGVSLIEAVYEVGSALTTNGISMGATTVTMPLGYKWLMIVAMTVGRIEIVTVFIALSRHKTKE